MKHEQQTKQTRMVNDNMVCTEAHESAAVPMKHPGVSLVSTEQWLSALSPSERKDFLESVAYHKDMLAELAKM